MANKADNDAAADNECISAFKIDTNQVFQKDRNTKCAPDTGQWFFHHPDYEAFQEAKGLQLLLVTAEAGGGKSTLMRTFVDSLEISSDRPIVAYFFFKDDDDQLRSYEDALSSILYQLFIQERGLVQYAKEPYKRYGHGIRYQSKEMWNILLESAARAQRDLICVIDAVDECAPAGRRQLVSDLVETSKMGSRSASTRLKFVVTSRPYQDENHPYADLKPSDIVRHLAGENAKVQADIQAVISFKAEDLAKKYCLSHSTLDVLIKKISSQNLQTRSFLAVRLAFELLDSHRLMEKGAEEETIHAILADIPTSLGDQYDAMLNKTPDKEHARRLFCVILAARKTLKIPEFKILYALTRTTDGAAKAPQSYDDLEVPADDEEFKQLVRARCGLFITFVRSSVHLFHQTAREFLMPRINATSGTSLGVELALVTAEQPMFTNSNQRHSWKGRITEADANFVMLTVCLDLINFRIPRSWVLDAFDSLDAGNGFHNEIKALLKDKPLFQYAALNWYEHVVLGGEDALTTLCTQRYAPILDVSKTAFWVWFLNLADYICESITHPVAIISSSWEEVFGKHKLPKPYGVVLRDSCLTKLFKMDPKLHNLFNDPSLPLTKTSSSKNHPMWTASDGYELIDRYHLAYGEYQYTSAIRAVQCIENDQLDRGRFLSTDVPAPDMIWTCISEGAPKALKISLAEVESIEWLDEVSTHIMYRRSVWNGWSSRTGKDLRDARERGWAAPCPPGFAAISRTIACNDTTEVFDVLADWTERLDGAKHYAQKFWEAGGFIEPSFCRRLVSAGASIDVQLWDGQRTALQIAAALWEHEAVDTLIDLGADPAKQSPDERTAVHWFLCGPEQIFQKLDDYSSRDPYGRNSKQGRQRLKKSRIALTLKALCGAQSMRSPLDQADAGGKYPLMLAARNSPTATKALLQEGADVEQKDRWGRTAIMHFFCGQFSGRPVKILKHLLETGANVLARDNAGRTVLQYWTRQLLAMELGSLYPGFNRFNKSFDILASAESFADKSVLFRELQQVEIPLSAAVRLGNAKLCWALLMTGANPNKHGLTTRSRLSANTGSKAMDLEDLNWKPLLIALSQKEYTTAAVLLAYGANVTSKTRPRKRTKYNSYRLKKCGLTALHLAVVGDEGHSWSSGYISLNSGGISSGCSFQAVGKLDCETSKESPEMKMHRFQMAAYKNSSSWKKKFKDESSDSEFELPKSSTWNDWTGEKLLPYDKLSDAMLEEIKFDDPLFDIMKDNQQESANRQKALVEILLKRGAEVNAQTQDGRTPLLGVSGSSPDIARLLLQYGADPNIADKNGETPLIRAVISDNNELVEILLAAGASPDSQLNVGILENRQCSSFIERYHSTFRRCKVPLTAMVLAAERGNCEVVQHLLNHGANPNLPITHHVHGRLPSKRDQRRRARNFTEPDSSESEEEPEEWKGHISVGTALTWARDEVRELLLRNGADPRKEEPLRECDCAVIEKRKEEPHFPTWGGGSDAEYPAESDGEGTDAELRRFSYPRGLKKWDGDTDQDE